MKKKILFVINSLGCGGAEKSLVSLLSVFDYSRFDVELQMFDPGGIFLPLLPKEVRVLPKLPYITYCRQGGNSLPYAFTRWKTSVGLRLPVKCHGKPLHAAQRYWKYASSAFAEQETVYDAAIAWGQGNPTHYVAEKIHAKTTIAFVNVNYETAGHNRFFDRPYYAVFDHIVSVSQPLKGIMEQVYPEFAHKMLAIYDIRSRRLMEEMARVFDPYQDRPAPILVTIGRMVKQKGYDLATAAARLLRERGVDFYWYLVGDGPEMAAVREDIRRFNLEGIMFPVGAKENPYPYIKGADLYVQTSRFEGFCLTLCEARALRVPPVSTDFDVVHDQLHDGKNGLIVPMRPDAIADGIERLLQDKELYASVKLALSREEISNEDEVEKLYGLIEG